MPTIDLPPTTIPDPMVLPELLIEMDTLVMRLNLGLDELAAAQQWTLDEQVQPDAWWMARAIQGEMGPWDWGPLRDTVALKIIWSIESRRQLEWWPMTRRGVIAAPDGYKGYASVTEPDAWALALAQQAIDAGMNAEGPLFVLSDADLVTLGIEDRGQEYRTVDGRFGLHFYWVWPGE